ncbi:Putative Galactose-proton symport [[Torrubiella] hemipterigena]|uniref:Putative Galactose-proton symport n=1 Tax=[Torrubiella] hemipterigena TaxID=1531966 RepID=A0A0A1T185_9HYPO|nr:Putative Galactose-proton symport [[Torrubiella] hemipterigena]
MAPLTPHWEQPSHPDRLELIVNEAEYSSKSISKISLPPFAVFSKLSFPPCTPANSPTYATVQTGKNTHLDLNSDLLYLNHSCEPSLIFDIGNMNVLVGPKGINPGDELTFFYPSTEWDMAQPFDCICSTPTCRGTISGARDMTSEQLDGLWLNNHIRELLDEQAQKSANKSESEAIGSTVHKIAAA